MKTHYERKHNKSEKGFKCEWMVVLAVQFTDVTNPHKQKLHNMLMRFFYNYNTEQRVVECVENGNRAIPQFECHSYKPI